jgi:hypothetical protein
LGIVSSFVTPTNTTWALSAHLIGLCGAIIAVAVVVGIAWKERDLLIRRFNSILGRA